MSEAIFYNNRPVATLHYTIKQKSREDSSMVHKYNIQFDSLECFEEVMRADRHGVFNVGGDIMEYTRFRREILERAHRIYPNPDGEFFDVLDSPVPMGD